MNSTTLITGASSGLGMEFAKAYAAKGDALILLARREDRLKALQASLSKQYGIDVKVVVLDLSDLNARTHWIENELPKLNIHRLINNAGFGYASAFEAMPYTTMLNMQRVNMEAVSALCYAVIPSMKRRGSGEILNVASVAGFVSGPYMAMYYATKAYVVSLSEALHIELKPYTIHVSALCPGPTHTEFFHVAKNGLSPLKDALTMDAKVVVNIGIRGLEKNQVLVFPGFHNWFLSVLLKIFPRLFAAKTVMRFQSPERSKA